MGRPHKLKRPPTERPDGTIEIHLTKGYTVLIDPCDRELAQHNWTALAVTDGHVYAVRGKGILLHRAILQVDKTLDVDHINGNTLDCRRQNLRAVSAADNLRNRKINRNNTSGFVGVSYDKTNDKWMARLAQKRLGTYKTAEEANAARLEAEAREWGIHPCRQEAHDAT